MPNALFTVKEFIFLYRNVIPLLIAVCNLKTRLEYFSKYYFHFTLQPEMTRKVDDAIINLPV